MLLTSESQSVSGQCSRIVSSDYDAMGNRTSATIASQGGNTFNSGSATTANQYTSITGRSAITHDANGNQLLNGAGAACTWNSENRLLTVTPVSPNLGDKAHVHGYDGLHRRVTRTTREWTSSGWTNLETTYFIYDGWNVIEEWASTFSPATAATLTRRLTWGQDLAGSPSLQGAGGVGGLLMVEEITSTTNEAYHFHYDGNGNVTEITDHLGASVATYRYDAFGNTLVATGTYAATNRYRFSTKPLDNEVTTAPLYYYGYRYYDPVTGRWPSRDPIGERGGVNLYGFVGNDGVNQWDYLGQKSGESKSEYLAAKAAGEAALDKAIKEFHEKFDPWRADPKNKGKVNPTNPKEYGGRVCKKCVLDDEGEPTDKYVYYTTGEDNAGPWPAQGAGAGTGGAGRATVHTPAAPKCDKDDEQVAWWHTHPPRYIEPIGGGKPYYTDGGDFSGGVGEGGDLDWPHNKHWNPDGLGLWVTIYKPDGKHVTKKTPE
jgi:RHS repeat-associated protein